MFSHSERRTCMPFPLSPQTRTLIRTEIKAIAARMGFFPQSCAHVDFRYTYGTSSFEEPIQRKVRLVCSVWNLLGCNAAFVAILQRNFGALVIHAAKIVNRNQTVSRDTMYQCKLALTIDVSAERNDRSHENYTSGLTLAHCIRSQSYLPHFL